MKKSIYILAILVFALSCAKTPAESSPSDEMVLTPVHPSSGTRVTETGFESGDQVGVYITRYSDGVPTPLQIGGNEGSNLTLTLQGSSWQLDPKVYWGDGQYDIYGYYPKGDVSSVDALPFRVAEDQNLSGGMSTEGAYERSDFLWAKAEGVTRTGTVPLVFKHRMCKVSVHLAKGQDYEGDLPTDAAVYIHNTVTLAYIDLATGDVIKDSHEQARSIRARKTAPNHFEAIVVPQRISNRVPLVEVVCGQVSYLFESTVIFKSGTVHSISITLSDNPEKVAITIGGEVDNW